VIFKKWKKNGKIIRVWRCLHGQIVVRCEIGCGVVVVNVLVVGVVVVGVVDFVGVVVVVVVVLVVRVVVVIDVVVDVVNRRRCCFRGSFVIDVWYRYRRHLVSSSSGMIDVENNVKNVFSNFFIDVHM